MRKHRHFALILVLVTGAGLLLQRSAIALSPTHSSLPNPSATARPRPGVLSLHVEAVDGRSPSRAPLDPLLALTTAVTKLTAPPAPPASPRAAPAPSPAASPPAGPWLALRQCESGDDYGEDTGNGYYGAYQFSLGTWESLGYGGLPSAAAPAVQNQAATRLEARAGWGQWPVCSRRLGLD